MPAMYRCRFFSILTHVCACVCMREHREFIPNVSFQVCAHMRASAESSITPDGGNPVPLPQIIVRGVVRHIDLAIDARDVQDGFKIAMAAAAPFIGPAASPSSDAAAPPPVAEPVDQIVGSHDVQAVLKARVSAAKHALKELMVGVMWGPWPVASLT